MVKKPFRLSSFGAQDQLVLRECFIDAEQLLTKWYKNTWKVFYVPLLALVIFKTLLSSCRLSQTIDNWCVFWPANGCFACCFLFFWDILTSFHHKQIFVVEMLIYYLPASEASWVVANLTERKNLSLCLPVCLSVTKLWPQLLIGHDT